VDVPLVFYGQLFMPDIFATGSTELVSGTRIGSVTLNKIHRVSNQDLGSTLTGPEYYYLPGMCRRMDTLIAAPNVGLRVYVHMCQGTRNTCSVILEIRIIP
jgi:hypothetical protein